MRLSHQFLRTFGVGFFFITTALSLAFYLFFDYGRDLPNYDFLTRYQSPATSRLYDRDFNVIKEFAKEKRTVIPITQMPKLLIDAFLSAEDKNFYYHAGIDFLGLWRAFLHNMIHSKWQDGAIGASTITQQVAKNFLVGNEKSLKRKIREAIMSFRLELSLGKKRILELYLNEIYLGSGTYGVAAAAMHYFGKALTDLTPAECAYLASLPKAPSAYHPIRDKEKARTRRNWVLARMHEDGAIDQATYQTAQTEDLIVVLKPVTENISEYFNEEVRKQISQKYGEEAVFQGGISVVSTLDTKLQQHVQEALKEGLELYDKNQGWQAPLFKHEGDATRDASIKTLKALNFTPPAHCVAGIVTQIGNTPQALLSTGQTVEIKANQNFPTAFKTLNMGAGVILYKKDADYFITQIPRVSGAMVVMDAVSGEVLALSGGYDFQYTKFNCATQAMRQPGSAFKPIVYLAALENGYTPESIIDDKSISFDMGVGRGMYTPKNYSGRSYGPSPLRHGIIYSRNQMTVNLANVLGITHVKDMAARLNVIDDMPLQLSMSLGAGETTLLRLSTAYAAIMNGGHQVQPHFLRTVIDRFGNHMPLEKETFHLARDHDGIIDWDTLTPKHELPIYDERATVLSDISCVEMTQMLIDVMRMGTGRKFSYLFEKTGITLGGKTGTTNDYKDAWFMGFVKTKTGKTYIIGVFVGYPTPQTLGPGQSGSRVALPIFASFVERAVQVF